MKSPSMLGLAAALESGARTQAKAGGPVCGGGGAARPWPIATSLRTGTGVESRRIGGNGTASVGTSIAGVVPANAQGCSGPCPW